jgi:N-acetylglucosamine-6-phosphate deacetylase
VAGAHGHNARETVYAACKQAVRMPSSPSPRSLALKGSIGRLTRGTEADIIAADGDPTAKLEPNAETPTSKAVSAG